MSLLIDATLALNNLYSEIDKYYQPDVNIFHQKLIELEIHEDDEPNEKYKDLKVYQNQIIESDTKDTYRVIEIIGSGSFCRVYKAEKNNSFVFKALKISKSVPRLVKRLEQEYEILKELSSGPDDVGKNAIAAQHGYFMVGEHACVIMDLFQRTLHDKYMFYNDLPGLITFVRNVIKQVLEALRYMHSLGYSHCDLKPDNIMLVEDGRYDIKLIDFGSTQVLKNEKIKLPQPLGYRSPEIIMGLPINEKIDIWSVGCIAAELLLDFPPFICETEEHVLSSIVGLLGNIPENMVHFSPNAKNLFVPTPRGFVPVIHPKETLQDHNVYRDYIDDELSLSENIERRLGSVPGSQAAIDFVIKALTLDPAKRPSAAELLEHPFFNADVWHEFKNQRVPFVQGVASSHIETRQRPVAVGSSLCIY